MKRLCYERQCHGQGRLGREKMRGRGFLIYVVFAVQAVISVMVREILMEYRPVD